ncbi:Dabb family protein [Gryllotalpicola ginsengisoli]|uniref:Dabb family protein n=1 Tax=Gryllotalpicola ginsengisoli TaxID=444608 RepID=UPI0003B6C5DB|nr:Dabb family protein [Gryllotalpicola ginsengisoli]
MTLRHIVAWTLKADDPDRRRADAEGVRERLLGLKGVVPSIQAIEVIVDEVDERSTNTVAVVADFADADGLQEYVVHPAHQEAAAWIRSVVSDRTAVDGTV